MSATVARTLALLGLLAVLFGCSKEPEKLAVDLLEYVPAETAYVFVTSRPLPDDLRTRLADHYAMQLAAQRAVFARLREQIETADEAPEMAHEARQFFTVLDAALAEFEGRTTAAQVRELGIEPVTRTVVYGLGLLPAVRMEIVDASRLNAMLDRIERRAGVSATRAELSGQAYRRIDLGQIDVVLAVTERHLIFGLLPDALFDRDLPVLLGQQRPGKSLADSDAIQALIERHGFTGYGEGYVRLDELLGMLLGKGEGRNAGAMQVLGDAPVPVSTGCMQMTEQLVAGMPRMAIGVTRADARQLAARGVWESTPAVAAHLQRLAAPVPGVGAPFGGLLAFGMGLDLPQLRNAIEALLQQVVASGADCEWVDPDSLQALMPQLNLALGPMTAGIKGFNLLIDDLTIDQDSLQPSAVSGGLLAAVDDPRGVFALGAMFNPALAALQVPNDGTFVDLPNELGLQRQTPPLKVAIKDKALILLAGSAPVELAGTLVNAVALTPAPLLALDYGVAQLVERLGGLMERAAAQMRAQGEVEAADGLGDQLDSFRLQAQIFERLRISLHASAEGLVMDEVMELR